MPDPSETISYDPESMCLPNSLEFAVRQLLGTNADTVNFEKYRTQRADELKAESGYTSPISTAKRENQDGKVVRLIAQSRDEFIARVLTEINQITGANLVSFKRSYSSDEDDLLELQDLVSRPRIICLLSIRGHIEPITTDTFNPDEIRKKINDSYEMIPLGNVTIIRKAS